MPQEYIIFTTPLQPTGFFLPGGNLHNYTAIHVTLGPVRNLPKKMYIKVKNKFRSNYLLENKI